MIVQIADDFNLEKIANSGQCFRWTKTGRDEYRIIAGSSCLYITSLGDSRYDLTCSENEYDNFWWSYFDLQEDYRSIRKQIEKSKEPFLWQASEEEKGIRILRQDPWEMLITSIIMQNRNIPAICRSVELLAEKCGEKFTDSRGLFYHAFPGPDAVAALSEEELLGCKLGYRWKYIHAAAEAVTGAGIDLGRLITAQEQEVMASLTGLFGVGTKVASCVSLFGLHHLDAFPIDIWVKRILTEYYPDGYPYERHAPYNGIFQQYMFAFYRHRQSKA